MKSATRPQRRNARLGLEPLEDRQLAAGLLGQAAISLAGQRPESLAVTREVKLASAPSSLAVASNDYLARFFGYRVNRNETLVRDAGRRRRPHTRRS